MVALEAAAAGAPLAVAATGGLAEIVEPGVTGVTFPHSDPDALAGAVDSLLGDEVFARQVARRARTMVDRAVRLGDDRGPHRGRVRRRRTRVARLPHPRGGRARLAEGRPAIVVPDGNLLARGRADARRNSAQSRPDRGMPTRLRSLWCIARTGWGIGHVQRLLIAERYRLLRTVGSGGMGRVWLARDEMLHRDVAVKEVVPPEWMTDERDATSCASARCVRPARPPGSTIPTSCAIYDVVYAEGSPWIVMEYVPSRSLHQVSRATGRCRRQRVAEIGLKVLDALVRRAPGRRAAPRRQAAQRAHRRRRPGGADRLRAGHVRRRQLGDPAGPGDGLAAVRRAGTGPRRGVHAPSPTCGRWARRCTRPSRVAPRSPGRRRSPR